MHNIPRDLSVGGTGRETIAVWVVFGGQASRWWLRGLRPGFRHCFLILFDGVEWISVDPLLGRLEIMAHQLPGHFDFPVWLQSQGLTVVNAGKPLQKNKIAPLMFCSCVEIAKRVLGIHRLGIITPYQLYRHLQSRGGH